MDDLTAPRIEPLAPSIDPDAYSSGKGSPKKREAPIKRPPSPSIESDETTEDIHQIDELA